MFEIGARSMRCFDGAFGVVVALLLCGWLCGGAAGCIVDFSSPGGNGNGGEVDGGGDAVCGNGDIEAGEACDDGNVVGEDGCDPGCLVEPGWVCVGEPSVCSNRCGNGVVELGEECDGADLGGATCQSVPGGYTGGVLKCTGACRHDTAGCVLPGCGDGEVDLGEECDDGNESNEDSCLNNCRFNLCGDGYVAVGQEACDDGNLANDDACLTDCTAAACGDGYVWAGQEECDDGANGDPCDGCLDDCSSPELVCGDGFVCGEESCDDGANGDPCDGCLDDCTSPSLTCGDGYVCGNEVCDGAELGGATCESQGFDGGSLGCASGCMSLDTSGCCTDTSSVVWVSIQGGAFTMGSNDYGGDEGPEHQVTVPDFTMTQSEVTVAQYNECVSAGACTLPSEGGYCNWNQGAYSGHPVNCVGWSQAKSFCTWVCGRLPSEAEWEYAARSEGQSRDYPWGNSEPSCDEAVLSDGGYGCGTERTFQVCSKPAGNTDQGLCDMVGNVEEWVQDWYHSNYTGAPTDGSAWETPITTERVVRGGHLESVPMDTRATFRDSASENFRIYIRGFRCVRDLP